MTVPQSTLSYDLTPKVTRHVGDMNPTPVALPNKLRKANLSLLLHLNDETEQLAMLSPVQKRKKTIISRLLFNYWCPIKLFLENKKIRTGFHLEESVLFGYFGFTTNSYNHGQK